LVCGIFSAPPKLGARSPLMIHCSLQRLNSKGCWKPRRY